jgi:chromosome segregation ATPase
MTKPKFEHDPVWTDVEVLNKTCVWPDSEVPAWVEERAEAWQCDPVSLSIQIDAAKFEIEQLRSTRTVLSERIEVLRLNNANSVGREAQLRKERDEARRKERDWQAAAQRKDAEVERLLAKRDEAEAARDFCDGCETLDQRTRERDEARAMVEDALRKHRTEVKQLTEDLVMAKELLREAEKALVGAGKEVRLTQADYIGGFLDMVRCSKCGERISHPGFLGQTGQCCSCDRDDAVRAAQEGEKRDG